MSNILKELSCLAHLTILIDNEFVYISDNLDQFKLGSPSFYHDRKLRRHRSRITIGSRIKISIVKNNKSAKNRSLQVIQQVALYII